MAADASTPNALLAARAIDCEIHITHTFMTGIEGTVGSGNPEVANERGAADEDAEVEVDGCPPPGDVPLPPTVAVVRLIREVPSDKVDSIELEELEDVDMIHKIVLREERGGE